MLETYGLHQLIWNTADERFPDVLVAVGWIDTRVLTDIANMIRQQNGTDTTYLPREIAAAVQALDGTREGEGAIEPYKELESGVVSERVFAGIAAAIRQQNGGTELYEPGDMAQAILDLEWETPELAPRALLLSDGTLEFTYLESEDSPSGGVVVQIFTPVEGITSASASWWADRESITRASFHGSFAEAGFADPSYWFYGCKNMTEVTGFEALSGATKMSYTFASCTGLAEADLSDMPLDVMERSGLSCLFYGDTALTTIYAQAGWSPPSTLMGTSMFNNCRSLVGGAGTVYDSRKTGIEYFRIDNPPEAPGYLTAAE